LKVLTGKMEELSSPVR